jgi:hypothetical protein
MGRVRIRVFAVGMAVHDFLHYIGCIFVIP